MVFRYIAMSTRHIWLPTRIIVNSAMLATCLVEVGSEEVREGGRGRWLIAGGPELALRSEAVLAASWVVSVTW